MVPAGANGAVVPGRAADRETGARGAAGAGVPGADGLGAGGATGAAVHREGGARGAAGAEAPGATVCPAGATRGARAGTAAGAFGAAGAGPIVLTGPAELEAPLCNPLELEAPLWYAVCDIDPNTIELLLCDAPRLSKGLLMARLSRSLLMSFANEAMRFRGESASRGSSSSSPAADLWRLGDVELADARGRIGRVSSSLRGALCTARSARSTASERR